MTTKYILPTKRKGESQQKFSTGFDPDFIRALKIKADRETEREGLKISQATIIITLALKDRELASIYKQLKKERNHAIKEGSTIST